MDRTKLYGSVSTATHDPEGQPCELATLAIDGHTLIPNGGTALAYLNADGDWLSRKTLRAVDLDGQELPTVESSFKQTISLEQTVSIDTFLNHSVRLIYQLEPEMTLPKDVQTQLREGTIYQFHFSYRGGVDTDPAFILQGENEELWLLISDQNDIEYVGLEQAAICELNSQLDTDETEEDSADDIDFGML
ncbi:MAG: hypothetical protein KTR35_07540 [Gammaproteobacteria bacterium]|nr:hypothetical protein [Gammaproteobacteria bacterium]